MGGRSFGPAFLSQSHLLSLSNHPALSPQPPPSNPPSKPSASRLSKSPDPSAQEGTTRTHKSLKVTPHPPEKNLGPQQACLPSCSPGLLARPWRHLTIRMIKKMRRFIHAGALALSRVFFCHRVGKDVQMFGSAAWLLWSLCVCATPKLLEYLGMLRTPFRILHNNTLQDNPDSSPSKSQAARAAPGPRMFLAIAARPEQLQIPLSSHLPHLLVGVITHASRRKFKLRPGISFYDTTTWVWGSAGAFRGSPGSPGSRLCIGIEPMGHAPCNG